MPKNLYDLLIEVSNLVDKDVVELEQELSASNETLDVHYFNMLQQIKYAFAEDRTLNLVAEMGDLLIEYGMDPRTIEKMFDNHNLRHTMCPDGECFPEYDDSDDDESDYTLFDSDPVEEFENIISMTIKKGGDK